MIKTILFGLLVFVFVAAFSQETFAQSEAERSPILYGVGSFFIPGLGQLLQEEPEKAAIHFIVALGIPVAGWLAALASPVSDLVTFATGLASLGWGVLSGIDAYRLAQQHNDNNGFSQLENTFAYQIDLPV